MYGYEIENGMVAGVNTDVICREIECECGSDWQLREWTDINNNTEYLCSNCWAYRVIEDKSTTETEIEYIKRNSEDFDTYMKELTERGFHEMYEYLSCGFEGLSRETQRKLREDFCFGETSDRGNYAEFLEERE